MWKKLFPGLHLDLNICGYSWRDIQLKKEGARCLNKEKDEKRSQVDSFRNRRKKLWKLLSHYSSQNVN